MQRWNSDVWQYYLTNLHNLREAVTNIETEGYTASDNNQSETEFLARLNAVQNELTDLISLAYNKRVEAMARGEA